MGCAERLQKLCVLRGLEQTLLAQEVGLSRSSISRILSGAQELKLGQALRLARALGVSIDYLADDTVPENATSHQVELTEDELTILKLVRRLGSGVAIDRLLGVAQQAEREAAKIE